MMSDSPNSTANTNDFEFDALAEARNYREALFQEFGPYLKGHVAEIGAGIGQMSEPLAKLPAVKHAVAVEPEPAYCAQHRKRLPSHELIEGTAADMPAGSQWDCILSINVLEHIREDEVELARYAGLLRAKSGVLCLFVPARPEIYAPIDKDFGHFRRYTKPELRKKLTDTGFNVQRLHYFNCVGYFGWWANFCLLKKRLFEVSKVRAYDRWIFPVVHTLETRIVRPPFGQSLLAIAMAATKSSR
jgi:SAM-dependent methyltransferase